MIEIRVNTAEPWWDYWPFFVRLREKWKKAERLEKKKAVTKTAFGGIGTSDADPKHYTDTIAP